MPMPKPPHSGRMNLGRRRCKADHPKPNKIHYQPPTTQAPSTNYCFQTITFKADGKTWSDSSCAVMTSPSIMMSTGESKSRAM